MSLRGCHECLLPLGLFCITSEEFYLSFCQVQCLIDWRSRVTWMLANSRDLDALAAVEGVGR